MINLTLEEVMSVSGGGALCNDAYRNFQKTLNEIYFFGDNPKKMALALGYQMDVIFYCQDVKEYREAINTYSKNPNGNL